MPKSMYKEGDAMKNRKADRKRKMMARKGKENDTTNMRFNQVKKPMGRRTV